MEVLKQLWLGATYVIHLLSFVGTRKFRSVLDRSMVDLYLPMEIDNLVSIVLIMCLSEYPSNVHCMLVPMENGSGTKRSNF